MANFLRVTPEQVKEKSTEVDTKGQEITKLAASANEIVQTLSGRIWSGEAQQAYITRFKSLQEDIERLNKLITDEAQHLYTIAAEYSTTEETNIAASGNLSEHVIA